MAKLMDLKSVITGISAVLLTLTMTNAGVFQSFEAENLSITTLGPSSLTSWSQPGASNNAFVSFNNSPSITIGNWLRFEFTNSQEGEYEVTVYCKTTDNRAQCQTRLDGDYVGAALDLYSSTAVHQVPYALGIVSLGAGVHHISFTVTGKNASSSDYQIAIDKIELNPVFFPSLWKKDDDVVQLITPADRVAVGTPSGSSTAALEVSSGDVEITNGKLLIQGWSIEGAPDYVFDKGYKLADLNTVEKYIKENNHLPEVPSAGEIEKEGLDITAMNYTLLKKIEELTLYIIEQNKKIEALEKKVDGK